MIFCIQRLVNFMINLWYDFIHQQVNKIIIVFNNDSKIEKEIIIIRKKCWKGL
jgi:hypothetical protein